MIHEVKGSRAGNDEKMPLFFCTSCEVLFIGVAELDDLASQAHGWPQDRECPECGYLDGQDDELLDEEDDDEDEEAGNPPLPGGADDYRS